MMFEVASCSVIAIVAFTLHALIIRNIDFSELYEFFSYLNHPNIHLELPCITKNSLQLFGARQFCTLFLL